MKIIYLNISSYRGTCLGATHYYGHLTSRSPDYKNIELQKPMTQKECDALNAKDKHNMIYEPGDVSGRFNSSSEVIKFAISIWKTFFPDGEILMEGSSAVADPQKILIAPEPFFVKGNSLYQRAKKIGFWGYNETEMKKIAKEWDALFD